MVTNNRRPGVYSQYDVSSLYTTPSSQKYVSLVAKASGTPAGEAVLVSGYQGTLELYGEDKQLLGALNVLFRCGVSGIYVVPVEDGNYEAALEAAAALDNVGAMLCDCVGTDDAKLVLEAVQKASGAQREHLGFLGIGDPAQALAVAQALNSERMVVACPPSAPMGPEAEESAFYTAAAVAGTVLAQGDPAYNWNGHAVSCITAPARLDEALVQELLAGGVTVVEPVGEQVQIVRALTTRTTTGGVVDRSMGSLNTILIIDEVMCSVRNTLQLRLRGGRISNQSLDSVLAQVTVELANQQDNGLIESFQTPKVYPYDSDPAICVVELSFQVAHVLSQIHIVAHIQV